MSKLFKITSLVIGLAMVLSFVAVPASAATVDELMAQIATLTAQISALKGGAATTGSATTFTRNLTVGSKGADVSALQQVLIDGGYLAVAAPTGYFGAATKAALKKYQAENGISSTGYFGPKTREFMGASAGTTTTGTTTTGTSVSVADGSDGSAAIATSPFVSTGQTVKKGETKAVMAARFTATGGKVSITRFDVHFSERPWLTLSKVTLKDASGNVLASKALTGAADATEVTVGSDYMVRFEGMNTIVTPGTDTVVAIEVTAQVASDKISTQTVTVSIPAGSVRTINGKGYTDSLGGITNNTFTFTSTGSQASIYTRVSPNSPAVGRTVPTSATQITTGVVLGVFGVKTQNVGATINSMSVNINNNLGYATSAIFSNVRISDGTQAYGAASLSAGAVNFTNLNIKLAQDSWKDLTLTADVVATSSDIVASSTLVASSISGVDDNYNSLSIQGSNVVANDFTLTNNSVILSGMGASLGTAVVQNNYTVGQNAAYKFTVANNGNNDVYVAKHPGQALATSSAASTGGATASSTISTVSVVADTLAGDTTLGYVIPAGASRTFTYGGRLSPVAGGGAQTAVLNVTGIKYGTGGDSVANMTTNTISAGLGALQLSTSF